MRIYHVLLTAGILTSMGNLSAASSPTSSPALSQQAEIQSKTPSRAQLKRVLNQLLTIDIKKKTLTIPILESVGQQLSTTFNRLKKIKGALNQNKIAVAQHKIEAIKQEIALRKRLIILKREQILAQKKAEREARQKITDRAKFRAEQNILKERQEKTQEEIETQQLKKELKTVEFELNQANQELLEVQKQRKISAQIRKERKEKAEAQKKNVQRAAEVRQKKKIERQQKIEEKKLETSEEKEVRRLEEEKEIKKEEQRLEIENERLATEKKEEKKRRELEAQRIRKLENEEKERQTQAARKAAKLKEEFEKKQRALELATTAAAAEKAKTELAKLKKQKEAEERAEAATIAAAEKVIQDAKDKEAKRIAEIDLILGGGVRIIGLQEKQINKEKLDYELEHHPNSIKAIQIRAFNLQTRNFENKFIQYDNNKPSLKPQNIFAPNRVQDNEIEKYIAEEKLSLWQIQEKINSILADRKLEQHIFETERGTARANEIVRLRENETKPVPQQIRDIYQSGEPPIKKLTLPKLGELPKSIWQQSQSGAFPSPGSSSIWQQTPK